MEEIRLGCLEDPVSRAQAGRVAALLEAGRIRPGVSWVMESGDGQDPVRKLLGELARGAIDLAVFPAAALPMDLPPAVQAGAILRDGPGVYCSVSRLRVSFGRLPAGAAVATCDSMALAQLRHRYRRLEFQMVRAGPELVEGVRRGLWVAACAPRPLVEACLLGDLECEPIPADVAMPPAGQGVVAILARGGGQPLLGHLARLNEPRVEIPWRAERSFIRQLGKDPRRVCTARAVWTGGEIDLTGLIADPEGRWLVLDSASAPARYAEALGSEVAATCWELAAEAQAGASFGRAA